MKCISTHLLNTYWYPNYCTTIKSITRYMSLKTEVREENSASWPKAEKYSFFDNSFKTHRETNYISSVRYLSVCFFNLVEMCDIAWKSSTQFNAVQNVAVGKCWAALLVFLFSRTDVNIEETRMGAKDDLVYKQVSVVWQRPHKPNVNVCHVRQHRSRYILCSKKCLRISPTSFESKCAFSLAGFFLYSKCCLIVRRMNIMSIF